MVLQSVFKKILNIIVFLFTLVVIITLAPGISPHINFESYTITPARNLDKSSILDKALPLNVDREIVGPESIAVNKNGDEIYTGVRYGEIVRIKNGKVSTVAITGGECRKEGHADEKSCGRPLGMRFDSQGKLLVADGYKGILRVDVETGAVETLVSMNEPIEGKLPKFPDDLDIDNSGNIYWSDASTNGGLDFGMLEFLGEPSGRLIKTNTISKESEVLLDGIHFANGIQLSEKQDFVLVNEFVRARVLRYFLKGSRKGEHDVFVDGLPGLPDNVRSNGREGFYISLVMPRLPNTFSLPDDLGPKPLVRKFILRSQHLLLSLVRFLEVFTGAGFFTDEIKFTIKNLGVDAENNNFPKKVIIVEVDNDGKIIGNLQNEKGDISAISEINVGPKLTYFGSPMTKQIWKMQTSDLRQ